MLSLLLASFVTFFVAIDPVAMAPMFTTMTSRMTPEWRRKMAFKSIAIATGILLAFAFGGAWLLEQIHVSIDAFQAPAPYEGIKIAGVTGISEAQRAALVALGAVE